MGALVRVQLQDRREVLYEIGTTLNGPRARAWESRGEGYCSVYRAPCGGGRAEKRNLLKPSPWCCKWGTKSVTARP